MAGDHDLRQWLAITGSGKIARRYFVTNGFDGALAMLGLLVGFRTAGDVPVGIALAACMGTAVALGISGVSSAYISEAAERRRELQALRDAMLKDMDASAHARATRWIPVLIALVNGLAPFVLAQLIMVPLWVAGWGIALPASPYDLAILITFLLVFALGVFLGRVGGRRWFAAGLRTLAIAVVTVAVILLVAPSWG
jgi:predicted membrane protein (TIGR00267 family)